MTAIKREEIIGDCRMVLGDSIEAMRGMENNQFSLAFSDPNYGRGEHGGTCRNKKVKQKNGSVIECFDGGYEKKNWDAEPADPETLKLIKNVSENQIIWGVNYYNLPLPGGRIV